MKEPLFDVDITVALASFDLKVAFTSNSQVLGVFGPSGSGKTTLLKSLIGIQENLSGKIEFNRVSWLNGELKTPTNKRKIGYVPQQHLLFPHWTVSQNLNAGVNKTDRSKPDYSDRREEVINILNLSKLLDRFSHQLSGGEKQRVALGRALCSNPELLLLDEPLASLDIGLRQKILPYLLKIKDVFRIPILIVSHNPIELLALCDEMLAIDQGKLISQGSPTDVLASGAVYQNADLDGGYQNVIRSTVHSVSDQGTIVKTGSHRLAPLLSIPKTDASPGDCLLLGIPSRDILIATSMIARISARNCIPGTIESISTVDYKEIVLAKIDFTDSPPVAIELTSDAVKELDLKPSSSVWLVFKSSSVSIYQ